MPKTYRELRGVMSAVDVDRPAWAEQYAVGDDIAFRNPDPDIDVIETEPVAGFSSLEGYEGLPVVVIPGRLAHLFEENVGTAAVTERFHVPPEEIGE